MAHPPVRFTVQNAYFNLLKEVLALKESAFQHGLIKEIKHRFPDAIVLKNDAGYLQGFPDLLVLSGSRWAALECKRTKAASHQPNQDYYVEKLGKMSYAAFVYPENREEVLHELECTFQP